MTTRRIVTLGGGFSLDMNTMDDFVLSYVEKRHPTVCWIGTASSDNDMYYTRFVDAFAARGAVTPRVTLGLGFTTSEKRRAVEEADVIYVGGGSTFNMVNLWRLHGVDKAVREAYDRGAILTGISAGINIWFEGSSTDSFGPLETLHDGLGFLDGYACPHYNTEKARRPHLHEEIAAGNVAKSFALDDGALAVFEDEKFVAAHTIDGSAGAYIVERDGEKVVETKLPGSALPA